MRFLPVIMDPVLPNFCFLQMQKRFISISSIRMDFSGQGIH